MSLKRLPLQSALPGADALALACDVSDENRTQAVAAEIEARWGGAHILVNGASNDDPTGSIPEIGLSDWNRLIAVQVTGAYLMSRAMLPAIIKSGGGSIILIASQLGHVGAAGRHGYCAAKGERLSGCPREHLEFHLWYLKRVG